MNVLTHVPLAPKTTLELGGPARFYLVADDVASVAEGVRWAEARGVGVRILGGGSNLIVPDAGFDGLVIEMALRGVEVRDGIVTAAAGESWDGLVRRTVAMDLAGIECLAGIPGRVGAAPIQNVGAYGQEVKETIRAVRVLDLASRQEETLAPDACAFAYRDSRFKQNPGRYAVLGVTFGLVPGGRPALRYAELVDAMDGDTEPTLERVRETVVALRRAKSMVIDPADPNRRSAGSFFTNPLVEPALAERIAQSSPTGVPRWPTADGRVKLAAGWLIEHAGMTKGTRRGNVGLSSQHALALVHHGGGTTRELLALAEEVVRAVRERFGVTLVREPVLWDAR